MDWQEMGTDRNNPLILLVEDIEKNIRELSAILNSEGYSIATAMDGNQALAMARQLLPDLMLLDIMIPGIDGIEVCQRLKLSPETNYIPIILLTIRTESNDIHRGFYAGAMDYITKPFNPQELKLKVKNHLELRKNRYLFEYYKKELKAELTKKAHYESKIIELTSALAEKDRMLDKLTTMDPLTSLYNYRFIIKRLSESIAESVRYQHPLAIILLDIDHFKTINQQHGRQVGDRIIGKISSTIKNGLRQSDIAGRYSGEDFLIILPHTDISGAYKTAERIRSTVEQYPWDDDIPDIKVTISGGVSALNKQEFADVQVKTENILYKIIMKADNLLFKAKENGRNRIERDPD